MNEQTTARAGEEILAGWRTLFEQLKTRRELKVLPVLAKLTGLGERPVEVERLAAIVGLPSDEVLEVARRQPGGHWIHVQDGLVNLDLSGPADLQRRRLRVGDRSFPVSGCAPDTLLWAALIDQPLTVEEVCAATGTPIRLDLTPDGVHAVTPPDAVVAFPAPPPADQLAGMAPEDIDVQLCSQGPLFASAGAAHDWLTTHPGTGVFPIERAYAHVRDMAWLLLDTVADGVRRAIATAQHVDGLNLAPPLVRLLVDGNPVPVERLAATVSRPAADVEAVLRKHADIDWDDQGRLEGMGLSLRPTDHRFTFHGGTLYGACVSDALAGPILTGLPGTVESTCRVTGRQITIEVTPEAVQRVDPPEAVISRVRPAHQVQDVRAEICSVGNAFSSRQAASPWLEHYPEGAVVSVDEEFWVTREFLNQMGWSHNQNTSPTP